MELSPQSVASTTFKTVKKGYDPDEVRAYLAQLATAIESTQAQATAMEARARAAVARLQELAANPAPAAPVAAVSTGVDEAETISRTLLLAQRTADTAIADAEADAKRIREEADAEARYAVDTARETQNRLIEEAKSEARRAGEGARIQIESEVQSLLARREFLLSDVDHLEQHIITHRDRLREVAGALSDLVDRVPGGLADLRRPLMSAVTDGESGSEPSADAGDSWDTTQPLARIDATPGAAETAPAGTDSAATAGDADVSSVSPDADNAAVPDDGATPEDAATAYPSATADDATPAGGTGMLFDEVTAEVPMVARPANDAFRVRGDDQR